MSAPPIEAGGPFSGRLNQAVSYVPKSARSVIGEAGGMAHLLVTVLWSAIRHPKGYWTDVVDEMHYTIKRSWISITAALFGFLLALSVPSMQFVQLAGVIGAAITAELGSRKVREELDAMQVMGIDPIRTLVVPRVVSVALITTLLAIPAELITILSSQFAARYIGGIEAAEFYSFLWLNMSTTEIVSMIVNCFIAGLLIGAVCCYKGLSAAGGAMGLGRAVNQAVVISFISLFVMQLGYNALILGVFPGLGAFR